MLTEGRSAILAGLTLSKLKVFTMSLPLSSSNYVTISFHHISASVFVDLCHYEFPPYIIIILTKILTKVSICGGANHYEPWAALLVGAGAGCVYAGVHSLMIRSLK